VEADLKLAALENGIFSRYGQLIHHNNRGSNSTSFCFSQRVTDKRNSAVHGVGGDSTITKRADGRILVDAEEMTDRIACIYPFYADLRTRRSSLVRPSASSDGRQRQTDI
jgi:hypothetical protein